MLTILEETGNRIVPIQMRVSVAIRLQSVNKYINNSVEVRGRVLG